MLGSREKSKEIRAVTILFMWELWKHHNVIVFDGVPQSFINIFTRNELEGRAWVRAGCLKGDYDNLCRALSRCAAAGE